MDTRQRILAAFARRALHGLREQRQRLQVDHPAPHDLDFYAHAAYQLREAGRQGLQRLKLEAIRMPLEELDREVPNLKLYRDVMAHAVDDQMEDWAWFGQFAGKLRPGGNVTYLIDSRHDHEKLERFYQGVIVVLDPDGELDELWGRL